MKAIVAIALVALLAVCQGMLASFLPSVLSSGVSSRRLSLLGMLGSTVV